MHFQRNAILQNTSKEFLDMLLVYRVGVVFKGVEKTTSAHSPTGIRGIQIQTLCLQFRQRLERRSAEKVKYMLRFQGFARLQISLR